MEKGKYVETPRFGRVKIAEVFSGAAEAERAGFTEPTHYDAGAWRIVGRHIGINRMEFGAVAVN